VNRRHVTNTLLVLAAVCIGYLCFLMAQPFLVAIAWAAVFATLLDPVHRAIKDRLRRPSLAAALTCVITLLCIIMPLAFISVAAGRELVRAIKPEDPTVGVREVLMSKLDFVVHWLHDHFGVDQESLVKPMSGLAEIALQQSTTIVGGAAGVIFNIVVIVFTLFFFLRDQAAVLESVRRLLPLSTENANAVLKTARDVIRACVLGGGAVSLAQGTLAFIGFWFIGVHSPLLWGVATSAFSFVPFVGAAAVWVPWTIVLLVTGQVGDAIILGLWGALAISLVDNVLRPIIIGDATKLHTLLIFFSIIGGIRVFGFLGLIMGPVVLAVGLALVEIFRREIGETEAESAVKPASTEGSG
jgi:predicted PurR-regulated permease PerM